MSPLKDYIKRVYLLVYTNLWLRSNARHCLDSLIDSGGGLTLPKSKIVSQDVFLGWNAYDVIENSVCTHDKSPVTHLFVQQLLLSINLFATVGQVMVGYCRLIQNEWTEIQWKVPYIGNLWSPFYSWYIQCASIFPNIHISIFHVMLAASKYKCRWT
jgi:hypothetical protein